MAEAGDVVENPVSGQHLVFRKTARDTAGEWLEVEAAYTKPTPSRPPVHYHPYQEERFEVLSGELRVLIGGAERTLEPGGVLIVAPGIRHSMWAERAGTRVLWQTRPALETEAFFETVWGLAKEGKTDGKGVPGLLRVALIAREYDEEYRLASPPRFVQAALFGALAPVSRLLGYRARYAYPYDSPGEASGGQREPSAAVAKAGGMLAAAIVGLSALLLLSRIRRKRGIRGWSRQPIQDDAWRVAGRPGDLPAATAAAPRACCGRRRSPTPRPRGPGPGSVPRRARRRGDPTGP